MLKRWTSALALLMIAALLPVGLGQLASAQAAPTLQSVSAHDPAATEFGAAFDLDEDRLVATAILDGQRVVYVYDLASPGDWVHSATIEPPTGSSTTWGRTVSVSGDEIVVTDPDSSIEVFGSVGQIDVFELIGGAWTRTQEIRLPDLGAGIFFLTDAWVAGDAIVVRRPIQCDSTCSYDSWRLYERDANGEFAYSYFRIGRLDGVGTDDDRLALAISPTPDFFDPCFIGDAHVTIIDAAVTPVSSEDAALYPGGDCRGPFPQPPLPSVESADLSGDLVVHELVDQGRRSVVIQREVAGEFLEEDSIAVPAASTGSVGVVPGVVLRAVVGSAALSTWEFDGLGWARGDGIVLPDAVDGEMATAGSLAAVRGGAQIHIVEIEEPARSATCLGLEITVDLGAGEVPTDGRDVVLGTPGNDVIDALGGDDVVCSGGGADFVTGGDGADVVLGGPLGDVLLDAEIASGEEGDDIVIGSGIDSWLFGGLGDDLLIGQDGDDVLVGNSGNDLLWGGFGFNACYGGSGDDTGRSCDFSRL